MVEHRQREGHVPFALGEGSQRRLVAEPQVEALAGPGGDRLGVDIEPGELGGGLAGGDGRPLEWP